MPSKETLRTQLITFREEVLKKTQEEVAQMLDITRFTYCRYENGTRNPKPTFIQLFSKVFNLSLEESYKLFYASDVANTSLSTGTDDQ